MEILTFGVATFSYYRSESGHVFSLNSQTALSYNESSGFHLVHFIGSGESDAPDQSCQVNKSPRYTTQDGTAKTWNAL